MDEERDRHALGGGMEADEPASPPEPPSPPPPPSPPSPAAPETPGPPQPEQPSEAYARQLLLEEWRPPGGSLELPPRLTWKLLFLRRPLYRNLLRSPNPEGAGRCGTRRRTPPPPGLLLPPRGSLGPFVFSSFRLVSFSVSLHPSLSLLSLCSSPVLAALSRPAAHRPLFLCHMSRSISPAVSVYLCRPLYVYLSLPASPRLHFCLFL